MSNARSPRDVCSTTIGTRGLMDLASLSRGAPDSCRPQWRESSNGPAPVRGPERRPEGPPRSASGRPDLAAGGGLLPPRRPQLVPRLGLLDRDRGGVLLEQVDGLPLGDVALERGRPAGAAQALQQLLRRRALALGRGAEGLEQV